MSVSVIQQYFFWKCLHMSFTFLFFSRLDFLENFVSGWGCFFLFKKKIWKTKLLSNRRIGFGEKKARMDGSDPNPNLLSTDDMHKDYAKTCVC